MIPIDFPETNFTIDPPHNADKIKPEMNPTRAFVTNKMVLTCWCPTIRERLSFLFFGRLWLFVYGMVSPPIGMRARREVLRNEIGSLSKAEQEKYTLMHKDSGDDYIAVPSN